GIMAKRLESTYRPDNRSKDWLKIKTEKRQEAVIGGYTKNEGTSKPFSALLLGVYEDGEFRSMTPVGTGWSVKQQKEIFARLKKLETKKSPFVVPPDHNKPSRFRPVPGKVETFWVKPEIVVEIAYREKTPDGNIRHPSFKGIREDKGPKDVIWETPITPTAVGAKKGSKKTVKKATTKKGAKTKVTESAVR